MNIIINKGSACWI